jgi:16S rRNA (cytosine1402-N4)-methyltransferase
MRELGIPALDGLLVDLGVSSLQLDDAARGFSFRAAGPVDMRMDPTTGDTAADLARDLDEAELADLLRRLGEVDRARSVARAIRAYLDATDAPDTAGLADAIARVLPRRRPGDIHPATAAFMALRIAVNDELGALAEALPAALDLLLPGGRLVVLAYHSLEDRIVKRFLAAERRGCTCPPSFPVCRCGRLPRLRPVGRQPTVPTEAEIAANPRARSARLRAAERLAA